MLTPDYLMNVAEPMVDLWSQLEVDITQDIARRLVKNNGFFTETAKWQALKAREMGMLQDDIAAMVKKYSEQSKTVVKSLVREACALSLENDDAYYTRAGLKPESLVASKALQEVIAAGIVKTNGVMRNFTNTTAKTATKAFENALDRAYMQVLSGAFSYEQALHTVVRDLALKGIEKIAFPSGRVDRADVAARRALVTGLNQTTAQLQLSRAAEMECYLVEVTSHAGARPSHAEWQGQIFWHGQKVKGYENLEDATGFGTGDGLCGWNCYHSFFPYFEGLSRPAFERDPSARLGKSNDQMYEEQQHQRYLERRVRDAKREAGAYQMAAKEAKQQETQEAFEQAYREARARLQKRQAALVDYCEQTGRTPLPERTRVAIATDERKPQGILDGGIERPFRKTK